MKKMSLITLIISGLSIVNIANAADGEIKFEGNIVAQTCTINDGGTGTQTVKLGDIPATSLSSAGAIAGQTKFTITLSDCDGDATKVAAHFESAGLASPENRLKLEGESDGNAKNVEIALYDESGSLQPVNGTVPNSAYTDLEDGSATMIYTAAYYATGTATAGKANSTVSYTLNYK